MIEAENEYGAEKSNELKRIYQFIELNRDFVLNQYSAYREKVKGIEILRLKLLNNQTTFKHELNLGLLSADQYQKKIEILDEKLKEQVLIKSSINNQFIANVFGGTAMIALPAEIIISYLQKVFL